MTGTVYHHGVQSSAARLTSGMQSMYLAAAGSNDQGKTPEPPCGSARERKPPAKFHIADRSVLGYGQLMNHGSLGMIFARSSHPHSGIPIHILSRDECTC